MKKTLLLLTILLTLISTSAISQTYPYLKFRKPTTSDNITWKFSSVGQGMDAYVTVVGSNNATVSQIDDSSKYAYAWQPFIRYTNNAGTNDTSYVDFAVSFMKTGTSNYETISNLAMTVVDLDGSGLNSYREMVQTDNGSATPIGIIGSTISTAVGSNNLALISGILTFNNIDTSNYAAMSQINFSNVSTYNLRVGVVGRVRGGTTRQSSFFFKPFSNMIFVLPVKLINFNASLTSEMPTVKWTTTSEENANRFEVYRSLDGITYTLAGEVKAKGNSQSISNYLFSDADLYGQSIEKVFYKLRIVDNDESAVWSTIVYCGDLSFNSNTNIASVYPNPCKGQLNINFKTLSESEFNIQVVDLFGKVYRNLDNSDVNGQYQLSIDLSDLSNGIYFVKVINETGNASTIKFVKN
ncbi:MAG: T9SS type A sorting domain-containing protein [Bacteroidia bacterium]